MLRLASSDIQSVYVKCKHTRDCNHIENQSDSKYIHVAAMVCPERQERLQGQEYGSGAA